MFEVGHCKDCCKKYDTHNKCNPDNPLIKHLDKDKCSYCNDDDCKPLTTNFNKPEGIIQKGDKIEIVFKQTEEQAEKYPTKFEDGWLKIKIPQPDKYEMFRNITEVIDIHKKKGIRPEFDVYIGRRIRYHIGTEDLKEYWFKPSKWHNPRLTLEEYELYIRNKIAETPEYYNLNELKEKRLGCWCITTSKIEPLKCHGQVLLKLIKEKRE